MLRSSIDNPRTLTRALCPPRSARILDERPPAMISALVIKDAEPEAILFTDAQQILFPFVSILIPTGCVYDRRTDRTNKRVRVGFSIEEAERSLQYRQRQSVPFCDE